MAAPHKHNLPLSDVVEAIRRSIGRDVSVYDESWLANSLAKRLEALFVADAGAYAERLAADAAEAQSFCASLSIKHSEFFRDPLVFALLEEMILPGLITAKAGRSEIRIWSAGCASGQEIYSLAILLDDLAAVRGNDVPVRLFATDASETELASARAGVYGPAAVENLRVKHLRAHFTEQNGGYVLAGRIRDRVDLSIHDLLDERVGWPAASIFGDFDIVVCANVLYYYQKEIQQDILDKIRRSLATDGYLVTGAAERAIVDAAGGFHAVVPPIPVFQRNRAGGNA